MGGMSVPCFQCDRWFLSRGALQDHVEAKHTKKGEEMTTTKEIDYARVFGLRFALEEAIEDVIAAHAETELARASSPAYLPMARAREERAREALARELSKIPEEIA